MVLQRSFLDSELIIPQFTLSWLKMTFCKAEQAVSRGRYKLQMGIIIDSVTQGFYMHEEQRLKGFLVHRKIWCPR